MADDKDILLTMFKHYMDQGLHHQKQRSTTANIVLVLSGALIGLITLDHKFSDTDLLSAIFLTGLGLFGALWSSKQHERYAFYLERASGYRDKLDSIATSIDMSGINDTAKANIKAKYKWLYKLRL